MDFQRYDYPPWIYSGPWLVPKAYVLYVTGFEGELISDDEESQEGTLNGCHMMRFSNEPTWEGDYEF